MEEMAETEKRPQSRKRKLKSLDYSDEDDDFVHSAEMPPLMPRHTDPQNPPIHSTPLEPEPPAETFTVQDVVENPDLTIRFVRAIFGKMKSDIKRDIAHIPYM